MDLSGTPLLVRLVAAVNDRNLDALVECFAEDYVNQTPAHPARGFAGREQVRRNWATILDAVPDLTARVTDLARDGNAVWSEWEMDGTRRDGSAHAMRGVVIFTINGDHIRSARFYLEPRDDSPRDVNAAIDAALGVSRP